MSACLTNWNRSRAPCSRRSSAIFGGNQPRDTFLNRLASIVADVRASGRAPIIHIETHGTSDETGLVLSSGEFVPWSALKGLLTTINITCRLNLLVVLAACNGWGLLEIVQATDRAPLWGIWGIPLTKV